ncbi:MAG: discoidin domain-containing protein [Armatimonadetes bacterium]|nr:discoidin domain-containing protein [Armatimonadota bacterium]
MIVLRSTGHRLLTITLTVLVLLVLLCLRSFALTDPEYIYAIHDPGGESHMISAKGWIVFTEAIGANPSDQSAGNYSYWANQGYGIIVRLNNGYGSSGTLPPESQYANFAARCANFIKNSSGCRYWIIGNETNLPREWPGNVNDNPNTGEPITSARYVSCYNQVYSAVKAVAPGAQLMPSPSGTWAPPYPGQGIPGFLDYWLNILNGIGASKVDALALHAYTHGCDPALVFSDSKMGPPYQTIYYNFRVYRNYLQALPPAFRSKPAFITECDQNFECADNSNPKRTWANVNSGWVRNIYSEINTWNQSNSQKVRCVALFRWPMEAEGQFTFGISALGNVIQDFQQAVAFKYRWAPDAMTNTTPGGVNLSLQATQIHTDSDFNAEQAGLKAIDGVVSVASKWTSAGTSPPHWLVLDLGAMKTVNGFIIRHAGAAGEPAYYNTESFSIQSASSIDGPWQDEVIIDNSVQEAVTARTYLTPKQLRYVRLYITDAGIDNYARIPEFEVRGESPPVLSRSPAATTASVTQGSSPPSQTMTVRNIGGGTLDYTITSNRSWLGVSPASGASSGNTNTHTITFSTASLSPTTYFGSLTVTDTSGQNPAQVFSVTLTVTPGPPTVSIGQPSRPFASFGPVTYSVNYTNATSVSLSNSDVTLNRTGDANGLVSVSGSGNLSRLVSINSITGDGTLGISLAAGTASSSGGQAPAAGPSQTFEVFNTVAAISPGQAKLLPDDSSVKLAGVPVSLLTTQSFYVEDSQRSSGLQIQPVSAVDNLVEGALVSVIGKMTTDASGERALAGEVTLQGGSSSLNPFRMSNRQLGGEDWMTSAGPTRGQAGVLSPYGMNNIGLLVTVWGTVISAGNGEFVLDDGSGSPVRCILAPGDPAPSVGAFEFATGISSRGADSQRLVKLRKR